MIIIWIVVIMTWRSKQYQIRLNVPRCRRRDTACLLRDIFSKRFLLIWHFWLRTPLGVWMCHFTGTIIKFSLFRATFCYFWGGGLGLYAILLILLAVTVRHGYDTYTEDDSDVYILMSTIHGMNTQTPYSCKYLKKSSTTDKNTFSNSLS